MRYKIQSSELFMYPITDLKTSPSNYPRWVKDGGCVWCEKATAEKDLAKLIQSNPDDADLKNASVVEVNND